MSTNDDCYLGACSLIEVKQSAVLIEKTAKSIILHFRNATRASLKDCLSPKAVDATENINGNLRDFT
jgi:hypothetical protein